MKYAFLFPILLWSSFSLGQKTFLDQPYIEVTGTSEINITPNEIYIDVTLSEVDKKGKISIEKQEQQLISLLNAIGFDTEKNLTVKNFSSRFQGHWLKKDNVFKVKNYQLLVSDSKMLGNVFEVLDTAKVSNASISRVSHSEIEKFRQDAKIIAIKTAKEKATYLTTAIDQQLGKALYVSETIFNNELPGFYAQQSISNIAVNRLYESKQHSPDFEAITLKASINVKFIIL